MKTSTPNAKLQTLQVLCASMLLCLSAAAVDAVEVPALSYFAQDADIGTETWTNREGNATFTLALSSNTTLQTASDSVYTGITHGVHFGEPGNEGASGLTFSRSDFPGGDPTTNDFTFELWLEPLNLTGRHVVFKIAGPTTGMSFMLDDANIYFTVRNSSTYYTSTALSTVGTGDYIQIVGTLEFNAGDTNEVMSLYVMVSFATAMSAPSSLIGQVTMRRV